MQFTWKIEELSAVDGLITHAKYRCTASEDHKLSKCDWTQVADAPVDKAAWATYRQALRDLPKEAGFPWDMTWPTDPNGKT